MSDRYIAVIQLQKKCQDCDAQDAGIGNRTDCGCAWEFIVGTYADLNTARMVAGKAAKHKGNYHGGAATGDWKVLDAEHEEEMVAYSL